MNIAEGTYKAHAVQGSEQYGKTGTGTDQIIIDLDLETGERVSTFLYFTDKSAKYAIQRLRAAGWTGDDLTNLQGLGSQEVLVAIKYEEYQGEQKMKVDIVTGGTVTMANPFDTNAKKAFGVKYASLAKAAPALSGAPKAAGGSDIPF